jgi:hypothetical protein
MCSMELVLPNELSVTFVTSAKSAIFTGLMAHNISFLNSGLLKRISLELISGIRPIYLYLSRRQVTPLTLRGKLVLNKLV